MGSSMRGPPLLHMLDGVLTSNRRFCAEVVRAPSTDEEAIT